MRRGKSWSCKSYGMPLPRRYSRRARRDYLSYAKKRRHRRKQVRAAIKKQLAYVGRDVGYLESYFGEGKVPDSKDIPQIITILKLYGAIQDPHRTLPGTGADRPSQDAGGDKKQEYQDNTDRIEVERFFSRCKQCSEMGCIVTKLEETQLTSIALSVFVSNLFRIQRRMLFILIWLVGRVFRRFCLKNLG